MEDGPPAVAVVGGGIIGTCVGYFLATSNYEGSITIYEKDPSYQRSSTLRSASAIRQQFNMSVNVAMSRFGYEFFSELAEVLRLDRPVDIGYTPSPYLMLAAPDGMSRLAAAHERQVGLGAVVDLVDRAGLETRFPWLNSSDLGGACIGREGEGWFDPAEALAAIRDKAAALAVRFVTGDVVGTEQRGERWVVRLADGTQEEAGIVVDAAGRDAARVARLAGIPLPIEARKRTAFVVDAPTLEGTPVQVVDPTVGGGRGFYLRPYGDGYMAVTSPDPSRDREDEGFTPDLYLWEEVLGPALVHRIPSFEGARVKDAWAGHYELNTLDQNAVIGRHPEMQSYIFCCGFSGHGVMHAPAAGRGIAELITTGAYRSIDLSPFGYERIVENKPLDDIQPSEQRTTRSAI